MMIDYDTLADGYDSHRKGDGPYMPKLVSLASGAQRVLEIGSGTGNNTAPFLKAHPCTLIGLEPSWGMMTQAHTKGIAAQWIQGSAFHLPLTADSVGFVFGVYMLHYMHDLHAMLSECARVLSHGHAAFITASTAFIDRHPMNRYFPSFAAIDKARFQPVQQVEQAFRKAGFTEVHSERFLAPPLPIDHAYADKVRNKFISTYELMPPAEYADGLARLDADVTAQGCLKEPLVWESVLISGKRTINQHG